LFGINVRILEINSANDTIARNVEYSLMASKAISPSFEVWHQHLLHAGDETVIQTMKAIGLEVKKPENWSCETCMLAKSFKQISRDTPFRSTEACAELHTDTIPIKPQGLGGFNYFMTIIDAATMHTWVIFLVQKSEAGPKLHEFIRWLEKQSGKSVKTIMRDGGGEYSPVEEKLFAREMDMTICETEPRTPEQNGKAEVTGC
jgi:hypothetical protein